MPEQEPFKLPEGAVAVVLGGGGGVGGAVARGLRSRNIMPILVGRTEDRLALTSRTVEGGLPFHVADITSRRELRDVVRTIADTSGPPLLLINAAGMARSSALLPPDDDLWHMTMAVNATGPWYVSTECLPYMKEAEWGFICNIGSTAGLQGFRYTAAYVASKHALVGLTRAMAADLEGTNIRVTAICPGFLDTAMTDRTVFHLMQKTGMTESDARRALSEMNASKRLIHPEEVAAAVLQLLESSGRNGAVVRIE